jgi:hypothetical protein
MGIKEITELVKTEYVFATLFILGLVFAARLITQTLQKNS